MSESSSEREARPIRRSSESLARGSASREPASADVPIPSIEHGQHSALSSTPSVGINTPAESPSPLDPQDGNPSNSQPGRGERATVDSINQGLERMYLSSSRPATPSPGMGMAELGAALESTTREAPRTPTNRSPLPRPRGAGVAGTANSRDSLSPGTPSSRRIRSSPRVNRVPHDVRNEEPPPDRFHEPAFQGALADTRSLVAGLAGILGSHSSDLEQDAPVRDLQRRAEELAAFRCPPTRKVGLVGNQGAGKSSLVNSLLDYRTLARVGGNGACTCVATEYVYHDRDDFVIEVVPFSQSELRDQLVEMVHAYRQYQERPADTDSADANHWQQRARRAQDSFEAMFPDRFTTGLLQSGLSEDAIVERMVDWAEELGPGDARRREVMASLDDCSALLEQLTSSAPSSSGEWRYIKKISVFIKAHILSRGLILVDLPGLGDLNTARHNVTERYLLECDEIFAVCAIDRAKTDQAVASIFELARQAKLSNVGIICTKSETVKATELVRDLVGEEATRLQELIDAADAAAQELQSIERELDDLEEVEEDDDDLTEGEQAWKYQLLRTKDRMIRRRDACERECHSYAMTLRNADVTVTLRRSYAAQIRAADGGELCVFCASNTLYWEWRDEAPAERALPFLARSGILAIRRHCMGLASAGQLHIATRFIRDDVPDLLNRVLLWARVTLSGEAATQANRRVLDALQDQLASWFLDGTSAINQVERSVSASFRDYILVDQPSQARRIREWTRTAVAAGQEWNRWNHGTYAAFCRKYGNHTTDAAGYHNWNEEAMRAMSADLSVSWSACQQAVVAHLDHVVSWISNSLGRAAGYLADNSNNHRDESLLNLQQALTSRRRVLVGTVRAICDDFQQKLNTLRIDAMGAHRTSFFGQAMEDAYNRASDETGTGSWARKKRIINAALGNEELFRGPMRRFQNEFEDLAAKLQTDIQAAVRADFDVIKATLDMVRNEDVAAQSDEDRAFRLRVMEQARAANQELARVLATLGEEAESGER